MEGNFMFTTPFWPAADSYHIHMMNIPPPDSLSPAALDLIHQATRLAEAASHIHPVSTRTGSTLLQSVEEKLSIICFKLAQEFDDPDTCKALQLRAVILSDASTAKELLPQIAGLDEQELVQGIGYMSTWVGKSRAQHYSAWFGLTAMTRSVLQGDTEAALAFLQCYSPHHQREEADLLLNRLGKTVDMIEYDQKIKGFTL